MPEQTASQNIPDSKITNDIRTQNPPMPSIIQPSKTRKRYKSKTKVRACVFCRRSHITCDRKALDAVCSNCIKRSISHLCRESALSESLNSTAQTALENTRANEMGSLLGEDKLADETAMEPSHHGFSMSPQTIQLLNSPSAQYGLLQNDSLFLNTSLGLEFNSLSNFLNTLETDPLFAPLDTSVCSHTQQEEQAASMGLTQSGSFLNQLNFNAIQLAAQQQQNTDYSNTTQGHQPQETLKHQDPQQQQQQPTTGQHQSKVPKQSRVSDTQMKYTDSKLEDNSTITPRENFLFTAVAPSPSLDSESKLRQVLSAKLAAGLLKPYNYAKGYERLQKYMDLHMDQKSQQRILKPLSIIRPAFREVARRLQDVDLLIVEESFERMLLSYDRVFSTLSTPAVLWRRTGEVYRGNQEFASLVGCDIDDLRDGKLAIFKLLDTESCVNYWEKYGSVAFSKGTKSVLIQKCVLQKTKAKCSFSFTIKRDMYNIPICIVGNFLPW